MEGPKLGSISVTSTPRKDSSFYGLGEDDGWGGVQNKSAFPVKWS